MVNEPVAEPVEDVDVGEKGRASSDMWCGPQVERYVRLRRRSVPGRTCKGARDLACVWPIARGMGEPNVLNRIGQDLSFTVSYTIAAELRDSAIAAGAHPEELIPLVFVIYLVLLYVPKRLGDLAVSFWRQCVSARDNSHEQGAAPPQVATDPTEEGKSEGRTLAGFFSELHSSATRITLSLAVQLVARSVTTHESKWQVRVLTLISIAIFFLYVEATGTASAISQSKDASAKSKGA